MLVHDFVQNNGKVSEEGVPPVEAVLESSVMDSTVCIRVWIFSLALVLEACLRCTSALFLSR